MNAYSMTKQCLKDMKRSLRLEWLNAAKERRNKNVAQVYIFISVCVCVQKKGNEPFQWIRCINTAAIILSRFKNIFLFCCSVPFLPMNLYPRDNSKGHLEGSLEMGWPGAASWGTPELPLCRVKDFLCPEGTSVPGHCSVLCGSAGVGRQPWHPLLPMSHVPGSWAGQLEL